MATQPPDDKDLEAIVTRMVAGGASQDDLASVVQAYDDVSHPVRAALGGAMEGVVPSLIATVTMPWNLAKGSFLDAISIVHGEKPEHAAAVVASLGDLPRRWDEGGPRERGKMVGEALTMLAGGAGSAAAVPLASKPVARAAGGLATQIGKKGGWPIRMMGAHQLGSGNPLGIGVMALPELFTKAGEALTKYGAKGSEGVPINRPLAAFQADVEKGLTGRLEKISGGLKLGLSDLDTAIKTARTEANSARAASARLEAHLQRAETTADLTQLRTELRAQKQVEAAAVKAEENAVRAAEIAKAREGLVPGVPSVSETLSARTPEGGREAMTTRFRPPQPAGAAVGTLSEAEVADLVKQGYTPDVIERLGTAPTRPLRVTGPVVSQAREAIGNVAARAEAAVQPPAYRDLAAVKAGRELERRVRVGKSPGGTERRGATSEPVVTAPTTTVEESLLRRELTPKVPIGDVPPSRSRRGPMSGTPGLTAADLEALGIDPNVKVTALAPEALQQLLQARIRRSQQYRSEAGMERGMSQRLDREPE